jgi:hypothetical protein
MGYLINGCRSAMLKHAPPSCVRLYGHILILPAGASFHNGPSTARILPVDDQRQKTILLKNIFLEFYHLIIYKTILLVHALEVNDELLGGWFVPRTFAGEPRCPGSAIQPV